MSFRTLLALAIALPFASAQAGEVIRNLQGLEAAVKCETPRSDEFEVECLVTGTTTTLADTFTITDDTTFMEMTDGVFWPRLVLKDGDRIRASGRVIRQDNVLYNYAKAFKIDILSHEEPPPPVNTTAKDLNEGKVLHRIVRVTGTVIDACRDELDPRFVFFTISSGKEIIFANTYCTNEFAWAHGFIGSTVKVTGKCFMQKPGRNRYNLGPQISTTIPDGLEIISPGPADQFLAPPLEGGVGEVAKALESSSPWRKVRGKVITVWHRSNALVRISPHRVSRVRFAGSTAPEVGEMIEAVGIPETDIYSLNLSRAQWRKAIHDTAQAVRHEPITPPDSPENVTIRFLIADENGRREFKPGYNGRLVRLVGLVQNMADLGEDGTRITIGDGGFELPIQLPPKFEMDDGLAKGSKIEVVGVCVMETETRSAQTPFPRILGCFVVPRNADDLRVIARPPWWTPARLTLVICALAVLILAVLVWNVMLK